jgi:ribose/xylose/arabinose/galactoside ABC-type transport system permease subunit
VTTTPDPARHIVPEVGLANDPAPATPATLALPRRWRVPAWGLCLLLAIVAELTYFTLTTRQFAGHGTGMLDLSEQFAPTGVLAMGLAMVILTGNIDLSCGANASLAAVLAGTVLDKGGSPTEAILLAIAASTLFGLFNGVIVAYVGIDSLLVTLATQFIITSIATSVAGASPPFGFPGAFTLIGQGAVNDIPIVLLVFLVIALAVIVTVSYTGPGRSMTLIGYNLRAAEYSGIAIRRTLTVVFTASGAASGVAGVLLAAYYNSAQPDIGTDLLLPGITAVILGGMDIFGGRGRIGEVVLAVLLLGYLSQGMLIEGDSSLSITMITGLVLIGALVIKFAFERNLRQQLNARLHRLRTLGLTRDVHG